VRVISSLIDRLEKRLTAPSAIMAVGELFFRVRGCRRRGMSRELLKLRHILVIRPDEIGDVVMTSAFLRELRRTAPKTFISLVVKPGVQNLVEKCPYVDEVLTWDWTLHGRRAVLRRLGRAIALGRRFFWRRHVDLAIYPRWDVDGYAGALLAYCSGARWRVGYADAVTPWKLRENGGQGKFFNNVVFDDQLRHEVDHNMDLLRHLGGRVQSDRLELWLDAEDEAFARGQWIFNKIRAEERVVALGVGARFAAKRWPMASYVSLAESLLAQPGVRVIVVGGPEDVTLGPLPSKVIDLRGKTTLRQTGAVFRQSAIFIGNDSGPMHMAAAAGIPVVEISGQPRHASPTLWPWPERFAPRAERMTVLRPEAPLAPCLEGCTIDAPHCISTISVEDVLSAASVFLSPAPTK
jgi:ADP-heptose:LPS heptosyltransferase